MEEKDVQEVLEKAPIIKPITCTVCGQQFASDRTLKTHIARKHTQKVKAPDKVPETLEIEAPPEPVADEKTYHCVDCGHALTMGVNICPGCGCELDWSGL